MEQDDDRRAEGAGRTGVDADCAPQDVARAALHHLRKFSAARGPKAFEKAPADYDEVDESFHIALIRACGSHRLLQLHDGHDALYDQTFRYRCP